MQTIRIIFFGSTADSVLVLSRLNQLTIGNYQFAVVTVVTQPPRPVGRKQAVTKTPVEAFGQSQGITVLSFPTDKKKPWLYENEATVVDALSPLKTDLLVTACYGQKIPWETIQQAKYGGLNVHPSLLPRWRGADPVPWAIASGDHQTGVTIVTLEEKFDQGRIITQKKVPILPTDTSDPLRTKLFSLGAELLVDVLPKYLDGSLKGESQRKESDTPYARRLTRDDGYEPWEVITNAITEGSDAQRLDQKFRAFMPWPGLWTKLMIDGRQKRLKFLEAHLADDKLVLDLVQLEGKKPVSFEQFRKAYL